MSMMPMTRPAVITEAEDDAEPGRLREVVAQDRADGDEREQAVDDGRDAGQHLDRGLGPLAEARGGVLRQVDRGEETDRDGDGQRDEADVERAPKQRQHSELAVALECGRPDRAEEELAPAILAEEARGLEDQRQHDRDRREDRDQRREDQKADDHRLDEVAGAEGRRDPHVYGDEGDDPEQQRDRVDDARVNGAEQHPRRKVQKHEGRDAGDERRHAYRQPVIVHP